MKWVRELQYFCKKSVTTLSNDHSRKLLLDSVTPLLAQLGTPSPNGLADTQLFPALTKYSVIRVCLMGGMVFFCPCGYSHKQIGLELSILAPVHSPWSHSSGLNRCFNKAINLWFRENGRNVACRDTQSIPLVLITRRSARSGRSKLLPMALKAGQRATCALTHPSQSMPVHQECYCIHNNYCVTVPMYVHLLMNVAMPKQPSPNV